MFQNKKRILLVFLFLAFANTFSQASTPPTSKQVTVYVFLSESCPISQSYTLTLKELYEKFKVDNINFVGVLPNYYSTKETMEEFKEKYNIPFALRLDKDAKLMKHFNATITPEVFVETSDGTVLYSGRIDDSFYSLGKRRTVITATELKNVLEEIVNNKNITVSKTQAVGCVISVTE